ncbi:hypothetical protein M422DRAFT_266350 [Sphaerobolus stellatus SS14]|uniref:Terpene synthase n=1 Tax=Sphaerobolus stellatus (strain SS14) TaxID=990650 RepID=A0A0C9TPA5_SPHS4|nr:hypothetical protein M422DRAFT_266350 [Sphaerobolus stellatus SS14]
MSPMILLPDVLAGWPCTPNINRFHDEVAMEARGWMHSYNPLPLVAHMKFDRDDFPLVTSLTYPTVSRPQLRICADLTIWFLLFDHITDDSNGIAAKQLAMKLIMAMRYPDLPTPDKASVLIDMTRDLWLRTLAFSVPSAAQRLLRSTEDYILAVCKEAEDRDAKHVRGIQEYLTIRRGSAASEVIFLLALLHLDISDEAMEHPTVRELTDLGMNLICIHNDIYSYNFERAHGLHGHNLVTAVMQEKRLGVQDAITYSGEMFHNTAREFMQTIQNLPQFTPEDDKGLREHTLSMINWIVALDEWSLLTPRYFGNQRFQVRRTRMIELANEPEGMEYVFTDTQEEKSWRLTPLESVSMPLVPL